MFIVVVERDWNHTDQRGTRCATIATRSTGRYSWNLEIVGFRVIDLCPSSVVYSPKFRVFLSASSRRSQIGCWGEDNEGVADGDADDRRWGFKEGMEVVIEISDRSLSHLMNPLQERWEWNLETRYPRLWLHSKRNWGWIGSRKLTQGVETVCIMNNRGGQPGHARSCKSKKGR